MLGESRCYVGNQTLYATFALSIKAGEHFSKKIVRNLDYSKRSAGERDSGKGRG
jgi:hypothetical protein